MLTRITYPSKKTPNLNRTKKKTHQKNHEAPPVSHQNPPSREADQELRREAPAHGDERRFSRPRNQRGRACGAGRPAPSLGLLSPGDRSSARGPGAARARRGPRGARGARGRAQAPPDHRRAPPRLLEGGLCSRPRRLDAQLRPRRRGPPRRVLRRRRRVRRRRRAPEQEDSRQCTRCPGPTRPSV